MSDAAPPFAGSQFSQITPCAQQQDECIDPALFNLPFENAETHDQATGPTIFHSHSGRALDTSYSPFAQHGCAVTSHDHVLNPQAAPFSPQASPSSDWRIGNSFAPLDPEAPSCLSAYGSPFLQPPHSGRYRNLESSASTYGFQYVPASEHNAAVWSVGAPASYPSAGITFPPLQQDHVNRAFLPSNQPRIASSGISASDVSSWARATYNPGASVHQDSALPVTPTTLTEESRRPSIAPTASTTTSFTCPIDGKEFSRRHEFNHHMRWHGEREHVCGICGKDFVKKADLPRHMKTHNRAERHLMCNIIGCKYNHIGFNRSDALARHNRARHPGNTLTPPTTVSGRSSQHNRSASVVS